ncbi:MAG: FeoA family protein [Oscillospiraceae bacterium]
MKTLREVKIGETVKVVKLHGEGPCQAPHHGHGHHPRTEVFVRKVAPLGDPMEVTVRGYELSSAKGRHRNDRGRVSFPNLLVIS